MEVDKIAINDNFSSENRKNTPTNSANEQDVRIFRKHVADEHKEDVSAELSDTSEDSVQDLPIHQVEIPQRHDPDPFPENRSGTPAALLLR